jgi:vitamin B12 transporter
MDETWMGQIIEASARYDDTESFGGHTTGSVSYGLDWPSVGRLSFTYARGFREPTFYDLYGPISDFYHPNPDLQPEQSKSYELAFRSAPTAPFQWKLAAFDNHYDGLITYSFEQATVLNVARARARGIEATVEAGWLGARWRGTLTAQRPRDEDTGLQLQGRAERYGSAEVSRRFGQWTLGASLLASGARFDSTNESPESRLGGYTVVDARVTYAITKQWSAQVATTNLFDKRYESAAGYDAPRRGVLLSVRFESF